MKRCAALVLICLAGTCAAQPPTEALELPPTPLVEKALAAYPPVQAAREGVRFELAGKRRLDVGPYEFAIRGGALRGVDLVRALQAAPGAVLRGGQTKFDQPGLKQDKIRPVLHGTMCSCADQA